MNQTSLRNVRSPRRKAYRVGITKNLFTMAKSIVKYPKAGGPSTTKNPSGSKRTTVIPATPSVKK